MTKTQKNIIGYILAIVCLIVINGVCFSPGFLGWSFSSGIPLEMAGSCALLFLDICVPVYFIYQLFLKNESEVKLVKDKEYTPEDYLRMLDDCNDRQYIRECETIKTYIEAYEKQDAKLRSILDSYFGDANYTITKYTGVLEGVKEYFYDKVRNCVNRISMKGEKDKLQASISDMQNVLHKLKGLQEELLILSENESASSIDMEELEELIKNTKYYQTH